MADKAGEAEYIPDSPVSVSSSSSDDGVPVRAVKRRKKEPPDSGGEAEAVPVSDVEELGTFSREEIDALQVALLAWYDAKHRKLPWRRHYSDSDTPDDVRQVLHDPYAVWVSEVMLQQTRVATVIDYYTRWMARWPTVQTLAAATPEQVREMWQGLGYYRRAKYLHEGAQQVVAAGGTFPRSVAGLKGIKGIGEYSAGAIGSVALGLAVPIVDGNVVRVMARLRAVAANPKQSSTVKHFWALAGAVVHEQRPGDLNQAVMELGATVCGVKAAACGACPVSAQCRAYQRIVAATPTGRPIKSDGVLVYPTKVKKKPPREEHVLVCVVRQRATNEFLLAQRPAGGLLASLWEAPSMIVESDVATHTDEAARTQAMDTFLADTLGVHVQKVHRRTAAGRVTHLFSHIKHLMRVECMEADVAPLPAHSPQGSRALQWVGADALAKAALSTGMRKCFAAATQKKKQKSITSFFGGK